MFLTEIRKFNLGKSSTEQLSSGMFHMILYVSCHTNGFSLFIVCISPYNKLDISFPLQMYL